jgi:hypothetical protein
MTADGAVSVYGDSWLTIIQVMTVKNVMIIMKGKATHPLRIICSTKSPIRGRVSHVAGTMG